MEATATFFSCQKAEFALNRPTCFGKGKVVYFESERLNVFKIICTSFKVSTKLIAAKKLMELKIAVKGKMNNQRHTYNFVL